MVIDTFQTIVMAVFCLAVVSERIREDPNWIPAHSMDWTTLGILLPILFICTMVINQFSHSLLKRINGLGQQMRMVRDGRLDVPRMNFQQSDELARLEKDFFFMLDEIKKLLVKQKEDGIRRGKTAAYFNPLFPYGKRRISSLFAFKSSRISIHSSHTGRDYPPPPEPRLSAISIHSSHTGRDKNRKLKKKKPNRFQSTLPIREETICSPVWQ